MIIIVPLLDAISQNFASCKKKRRQEQSGTYERYQQDQKRRQRMKRVCISDSLISMTNYLTLSLLVNPWGILSDDITKLVKRLSKHEIS